LCLLPDASQLFKRRAAPGFAGFGGLCRRGNSSLLRFDDRQADRKGRDRAEAIGRMKRALEMFVIEGIKTSIPGCTAAFWPTGLRRRPL